LGYFSVGATGWEGSKKLSSAFFKITDSSEPPEQAYELPLVQAGESIGLFIDDTCGIDVVLDYGDYELPASELAFDFNLDFARKATNSIDLTTVSGGAFAQKVAREQIFQFVDIAALYGAAQQQGLSVSSIDAQGNLRTETGDNIFSLITSKFTTKNNWYIYIQSDRQRSYNFYGNYTIGTTTNSLKIGTSATNTTAIPYANNSWPLLIINSSQNHNNSQNTVFIQLVTDNRTETILYAQFGTIENAIKNNFYDFTTLLAPPDEDRNGSDFTNSIALSNPAISSGSSKLNIANLSILIYHGKAYDFITEEYTNELNELKNIYTTPNFFDDKFDLINADSIVKVSSEDGYSTINSLIVKVISYFSNKRLEGVSAVNCLRITDVIETNDENQPILDRVIYITEIVNLLNNPVSKVKTISSNIRSSVTISNAVGEGKTYKMPEPDYLSLKIFTEGIETIKGIELKTQGDSNLNKIILGMSKDENDSLRDIIHDQDLKNSKIFMIDLFEEGSSLLSEEGVLYQKFKLGVVGEQVNGELKLFLPEETIMVYSLDNKYYFTKKFSSNVVTEPTIDNHFEKVII
jgi:hypothetical protein